MEQAGPLKPSFHISEQPVIGIPTGPNPCYVGTLVDDLPRAHWSCEHNYHGTPTEALDCARAELKKRSG
jgi:hypothetical protein